MYENYPKLHDEQLKSSRQKHFVNSAYWRRDMSDLPLTVYVETGPDSIALRACYREGIMSASLRNAILDALVSEFTQMIEASND